MAHVFENVYLQKLKPIWIAEKLVTYEFLEGYCSFCVVGF